MLAELFAAGTLYSAEITGLLSKTYKKVTNLFVLRGNITAAR
jgi:hypothetical protein